MLKKIKIVIKIIKEKEKGLWRLNLAGNETKRAGQKIEKLKMGEFEENLLQIWVVKAK